MEAKVTIYWGTGIDPQNIPYNINTYLARRDHLSVSAVWTLQTKDLAKIRLDAVAIKSAGQEIMDADYLTVEDDCYFIGEIIMLSEMTAELTLIPDYIDSLGGLSVLAGKISGWDSRAHVALADDKLFSNTIEEPFTPSAPLEITGYEKLTGDDTSWGTTVVAANVDLTKIVKNEALEYKTASGETAIIPQLQPVPSAGTAEENKVAECFSYMELPVAGGKKRVIPATACFPFRSTGIQKGIQTARSLGMEDTITAEYVLPDYWGSATLGVEDEETLTAVFTSLHGVKKELVPTNSKLTLAVPGTYKNKKVSSKMNEFVLMSMCSGDKQMFDAQDLRNESGKPKFIAFSDPAPDGRPYCQPKYYEGGTCPDFAHAVQGATWQNAPLVYSQASGSAISTAEYAMKMANLSDNYGTQKRTQALEMTQSGLNLAKDTIGTLTNDSILDELNPVKQAGEIAQAGIGLASGTIGMVNQGLKNAQANRNAEYQMNATRLAYNVSQRVVVPEIRFPQATSLQNYIGNGFYLYRVCMSEADCKRFDKFLTMYGYAQDKPFEASDLTNRSSFNYIKMSDVQIANTGNTHMPRRYILGAEAQLSHGVRVWHVAITNNFEGITNT